jgi:hypothetical protein
MTDSPVTPRRRLDSWKEIADHLGRGVRTALRWERGRGMPVHRVPGRRGAVYAYSDEIDRWLAGQDLASLAEAVTADDDDEAPPRETERSSARTRWRLALGAGLGTVALATVLAVGLGIAGLVAPRESPAALRLQGRSGHAYGHSGRQLWEYDFGRSVPDLPPEHSAGHWRSTDIDADGEIETLLSVPFPLPDRVSEAGLFCLSSEGTLRWSFTPDLRRAFGAGAFGPPWRPGPGKQLLTYSVGGQARVAWILVSQPWWPSAVLFLDPAGQRLATYVSSGWVWTVVPLETPDGTRLLVGGVSNAHGAPAVAALDAARPGGASPEADGSPFACLDCEEGRPLRYLVLSTSELTRAKGRPYSWVTEIRVQGDEVHVRAQEDGFGGIYVFDRTFALQRTSWTDEFAVQHRELEADGRIDHALERCPERHGPLAAREWSPERGWADLTARRPPFPPGR